MQSGSTGREREAWMHSRLDRNHYSDDSLAMQAGQVTVDVRQRSRIVIRPAAMPAPCRSCSKGDWETVGVEKHTDYVDRLRALTERTPERGQRAVRQASLQSCRVVVHVLV